MHGDGIHAVGNAETLRRRHDLIGRHIAHGVVAEAYAKVVGQPVAADHAGHGFGSGLRFAHAKRRVAVRATAIAVEDLG